MPRGAAKLPGVSHGKTLGTSYSFWKFRLPASNRFGKIKPLSRGRALSPLSPDKAETLEEEVHEAVAEMSEESCVEYNVFIGPVDQFMMERGLHGGL